MSDFDDETRMLALGGAAGDCAAPGQVYSGQVHGSYNIGANPNGGYLLALAANALRQATPTHPDPLSITVHYLRPGLAGQACRAETQVLRSGRSLSTARATLMQDGTARLELLAAMGTLGTLGTLDALGRLDKQGAPGEQGTQNPPAPPLLTLPAPDMPPPDQCPARSPAEQGVDLPVLRRLDIRLHPQQSRAGGAGQAIVSGWIRFQDGRPPDALACLLFADAFPPAVFGLLGVVGWVPTVELTVHLRRRPAPGWILAQFRAFDLCDGRVIEDGALWDSTGQLVAQSRQLALVRQGSSAA